jgi:hypothetical protein
LRTPAKSRTAAVACAESRAGDSDREVELGEVDIRRPVVGVAASVAEGWHERIHPDISEIVDRCVLAGHVIALSGWID